MGLNVDFWKASWIAFGDEGGRDRGRSCEGRRDFDEGLGSWVRWWDGLAPDRIGSWLSEPVIEAWTSINFFVKSSTAKGERGVALDEGRVWVRDLPVVLIWSRGGVSSCWNTVVVGPAD